MLSDSLARSFYRVGISTEPQLSTNIHETLWATLYQQNRTKKFAANSHSVTK